MKVKIINSDYAIELENEINEFIKEIEKQHMEVKDIKFIWQNHTYKALIMYGPDGKIYLEPITFDRATGPDVRV